MAATPTEAQLPAVFIKSGQSFRVAFTMADVNQLIFDGWTWQQGQIVTVVSKTLSERVKALEDASGIGVLQIKSDGTGSLYILDSTKGTTTPILTTETISASVAAALPQKLVAGANVQVVPKAGGVLEISVPTLAGGGASQDTLMSTLTSTGSLITITRGSNGTVNLATTATKNLPDATLLDLAQHSGSLPQSKVEGLATTIQSMKDQITSLSNTVAAIAANGGGAGNNGGGGDTGGGTTPTGPDGKFLLYGEMNPYAGNTSWAIQNNSGTMQTDATGWNFVPTDSSTLVRASLVREPFTIPTDGTADQVTFAITVSSGSPHLGIDWFSGTTASPTYLGTTDGTDGASTVTGIRTDYGAPTLIKPWVKNVTAGSVLRITKVADIIGTTKPNTNTGGTTTPPGGGTGTGTGSGGTPANSLASTLWVPSVTDGRGTTPPVAGRSALSSWHRFWGKSEFARPPAPGWQPSNPSDKFWAGRALAAQTYPATSSYAGINITGYNIPIYLTDSRQTGTYRKQPIAFDAYAGGDQRFTVDKNGRSFAADLSGGIWMTGNEDPGVGTDKSIGFLDVATMKYSELWIYNKAAKSCGFGGFTDNVTTSNGCHDRGSDVATGLHGGAIQIGIDEMLAGRITHMIGLEAPKCGGQWNNVSWPATFADSTGGTTAWQGQRMMLDPTFDVTTLKWPDGSPCKYLQIIARACQEFGVTLTDTSGSVMFRGEMPGPWQAANNTTQDPWSLIFEKRGDWWMRMPDFPWSRLIALPLNYGQNTWAAWRDSGGSLAQ